jgi:hypothetical protein
LEEPSYAKLHYLQSEDISEEWRNTSSDIVS